MIPRADLLDPRSTEGIEVFQLTSEPEVPSSHIYMEAQIFTPDSRRFILHRSAHAHGSDQHDPQHRYLLCDLDNGGQLSPLTEETGATGPSISPDGRYLYYFVNETEIGGGALTLKRVQLDGTERETLFVLDAPLPDTDVRPSRIYPLSTISSDGKRIAISGYLGDGHTQGAPYGLMVFDIEGASVRLVLQGPSWCNLYPQYSRSLDAVASHDIRAENHDNEADEKWEITWLVGGSGRTSRDPRRQDQFPQHALGPGRQRILPGPPVLAWPQPLGHHQHRHETAAGVHSSSKGSKPTTPGTWG